MSGGLRVRGFLRSYFLSHNAACFQRREWERKQLACIVDFGSAAIDPAPFQLVEDTSLYKVHSIFSLLGIRRAYVTKCGVLVGVVALRDVCCYFKGFDLLMAFPFLKLCHIGTPFYETNLWRMHHLELRGNCTQISWNACLVNFIALLLYSMHSLWFLAARTWYFL